MTSPKERKQANVPEAASADHALPPAEPSGVGDERLADEPVGETAPTAGPLSPKQIEELKTKAAKADEHWDRLLRATADLENFKKRAARERQDAIRFANASLFEKLIPALDNFDMALAAANNTEGNSLESLKTGITMVYNRHTAAPTEGGPA